MKLLIAYGTKTGSSREMAELLADLLPAHEVTLADLEKTTPDPRDFDYVVLGGSVRMGRLHRAVRRYQSLYGKALAAVPHTLFLCCAVAEQFENYAEMSFSADILKSAKDCLYFGGSLEVSRHRGLDRLIVRMMRNAVRESEDEEAALPGLLPEHVRLLAERLREK